ncbi:hypothetical protein C8R44DRAFT_872751 [Mycena epipterygia]|nr:hypothetical protein C8R44DRAFT_872751 [Mycena epipterygia]
MSQSSQIFECRWGWCRDAFATVPELLAHVRHDHVQKTVPCPLWEIPMLIRAEEGEGESMSGITIGFQSYSQSGAQDNNSAVNPSLSLPSPPASSPIERFQSPTTGLSQSPSERAAKRRRVMPPPSPSRSRSPSLTPPLTPPPRGPNVTPTFATIASQLEPDSEVIPNPKFPTLNTLIAGALAPRTPNKTRSQENPGSKSFSGSDRSVERHLTQSDDMDFDDTSFDRAIMNFDDEILRANGVGDLDNVYREELHWSDEPAPDFPRSRSQTPSQSSQSQSQSQQQRSPGRPKKTVQPPSPATILARQNGSSPFSYSSSPRALSKAQNRLLATPIKTFSSGSLKIHSPVSPGQSGTVDPNILSQPSYPSQMESFVLQTQAPYRSQSMSQ